MVFGKAIISNLSSTNFRIFKDGKTRSKVLLSHTDWKVEKGDNIDSKAFFSTGIIELPEGAKIDLHSHENREEIYFILKGKGEITVDGSSKILNQGDVIWFPSKTMHGLYNLNKEILQLYFATAVTSPGHMAHD